MVQILHRLGSNITLHTTGNPNTAAPANNLTSVLDFSPGVEQGMKNW